MIQLFFLTENMYINKLDWIRLFQTYQIYKVSHKYIRSNFLFDFITLVSRENVSNNKPLQNIVRTDVQQEKFDKIIVNKTALVN
jgi:hypothetical protein